MEEKALEALSKSQLEWIILEMHRRYVPHGKGKPKRYRTVLERLERIVEE